MAKKHPKQIQELLAELKKEKKSTTTKSKAIRRKLRGLGYYLSKEKSKPTKAEFIKFNTIKEYINDILKMRSSESAVKKSLSEFNSAIEKVLQEAGELAKEDKRNTVMDQDIISAVEKHLGKRNLTWQETAEEIIRQNPTYLGKISKAINDYIEKDQWKK